MRSEVLTVYLVIVQDDTDEIILHNSIINKLNNGDFKVCDYSPSDKLTITLDFTSKDEV